MNSIDPRVLRGAQKLGEKLSVNDLTAKEIHETVEQQCVAQEIKEPELIRQLGIWLGGVLRSHREGWKETELGRFIDDVTKMMEGRGDI